MPSSIRFFPRLLALVAVTALGAATVPTARGESAAAVPADPRPAAAAPTDAASDSVDVWLASTRRLPGICGLPRQADLAFERCADPACGRWEPADLAGLLDDPSRPLVIFVHGNRYESAAAKSQGLRLARHCAAASPGCRPRMLIFSWPSTQQSLLLKDGRAKYERAFTDGHYLAWLLGRVEPERPVAVIGYSFGAIITLEAFEDLVAAERSGREDVQPWTNRPGRTHLVFVAPALRCDALAPRGPYRETFACFERLTLVTNSRDDALKFFPWLDRDVRADALGYVGMPRRWVPGDVEFAASDAASIVGKSHTLMLYLNSPALTRRITSGAVHDLAP